MDINCVDACYYQKDGKCTLGAISGDAIPGQGGQGGFTQQSGPAQAVGQVGLGDCVYCVR